MGELFVQFGVDWHLLLAQAVNFGVLLFLLARFVYRPILAMLAKRRQDIEKGIRFTKEAQESRDRADAIAAERMREARASALTIVTSAEETARIRKEEIAQEAIKKSEAIVADARRLIVQEKAKMMESAYGEAENIIERGIAQVLGKMHPAERDRALIREALTELKALQS